MHAYKQSSHTTLKTAALASLAFAIAWVGAAAAQMQNPHHGVIGGPWEVVVKMGHEGETLRLPLTVADENKPQKLGKTLPVMGTPVKVRIEQYLPDLAWETVAVDDPNGAAVAKLSLRGPNLVQDLWLSAGDIARQSISSHIGAVGIRELPGGLAGAAVVQQLADPETVGVLLVWLDDAAVPLPYAVKSGMSTALPGGQWKLSIPRYVPHYSIDRQTKEVSNLSDQPVNPAVQVRVEGEQGSYEQWVWSKFPSSPHMRLQLPFRVRFIDFHVSAEPGQYLLTVAEGLEPRMLHWQDQRKVIEPVELGKRYPFGTEGYSLAVEEIRYDATMENRWKNASEMLLHPAVVVSVLQGDNAEEAILELGKPNHQPTKFGTLVMFYRRVP
ncbi:MAG: hypothetical protein JW993_00460 [Sedimentisphaerales bacterium]|nr:hypothetical protein [Sedimentisphaerales bacterium]